MAGMELGFFKFTNSLRGVELVVDTGMECSLNHMFIQYQ